jgi:hypothetical protein
MPSQIAAIDREPIYAALHSLLVAQLEASPPVFVTVGRRHVMPPDLTAAQQPALFSVGVEEDRMPRPHGTGGKLVLTALLFVYCYASALNQTPVTETILAETQMNGLLKAVESALEPRFPNDPNGRLTLGGLVQHCWIEGKTVIGYGEFGQQAGAIIPVKILVP